MYVSELTYNLLGQIVLLSLLESFLPIKLYTKITWGWNSSQSLHINDSLGRCLCILNAEEVDRDLPLLSHLLIHFVSTKYRCTARPLALAQLFYRWPKKTTESLTAIVDVFNFINETNGSTYDVKFYYIKSSIIF